MERKINWAILAPGIIANSMAEAMNAVCNENNINLYAVASRNIQKALDFSKKWNFQKAYGSYEELFNDPAVDAIYIANPHAFHFESVINALNNNKHILCEKPAGCSIEQLEKMITLATEKKLFFMEAMWTAFNPCIKEIINEINKGAIGKIKHIESRFCNRIPYDPNHRLYSSELAGGALLDLGIYNIYFAMMITNFSKIKKQNSIVRMKNGVDVWNSINISFENDITTSFQSASDMTSSTDTHDAIIFGTKGFIKVKNFFMTQHAQIYKFKNEYGNENFLEKEINIPFIKNGYEYELIHATECIINGIPESTVHTFEKSKYLCSTMDTIRKDWNMKYPWEEN